mgnify:FL=1
MTAGYQGLGCAKSGLVARITLCGAPVVFVVGLAFIVCAECGGVQPVRYDAAIPLPTLFFSLTALFFHPLFFTFQEQLTWLI